jgi:hypothetical protein
MIMKTLTLIVVGALALASASAEAHGFYGPRIGIGLGFGYPAYGWYDPWLYGPYAYGYPYPYAYRAPAKQDDKPTENLFAYPAKGQSAAQTAQDRQECNTWAVEQSGLDPATAKKRAKAQHQDDYNRAFIACMQGRDYTVK